MYILLSLGDKTDLKEHKKKREEVRQQRRQQQQQHHHRHHHHHQSIFGNWMMIFAGEEGVDWPRDLLVPQLHESEGHYCRKPHSFSCLIGCERGIGQVNFPTGWNWHRVGGRWVYSF